MKAEQLSPQNLKVDVAHINDQKLEKMDHKIIATHIINARQSAIII